MKPTVAPCACGSRTKCQPVELAHRTYALAAGRSDPAEHYATLGGYDALDRLLVSGTAFRLRSCASLWLRDGAGSPWHAEYWRAWDRRQLIFDLEDAG